MLTLAVCAVAPVTCSTNTLVAAQGVLTHAVAAARGRILHTFIHIWDRDEDTGQLLMHSFMTVFSPLFTGFKKQQFLADHVEPDRKATHVCAKLIKNSLIATPLSMLSSHYQAKVFEKLLFHH